MYQGVCSTSIFFIDVRVRTYRVSTVSLIARRRYRSRSSYILCINENMCRRVLTAAYKFDYNMFMPACTLQCNSLIIGTILNGCVGRVIDVWACCLCSLPMVVTGFSCCYIASPNQVCWASSSVVFLSSFVGGVRMRGISIICQK